MIRPAPAFLAIFMALGSSGQALAWGDLYAFPTETEQQSAPNTQFDDPAPAVRSGRPADLDHGIPSLSMAGDLLDGKLTDPPAGQGTALPADREVADPMGICIAAIMAAEEKFGIPKDLLLAIGLQEAGTRREGVLTIWPWVVNSHGAGHIFDRREQAEAFVRSEHSSGRTSTDIGCLQINSRWHPDAFNSVEAGFDPWMNAEYAAGYLLELHEEAGDWMTAAGNYHSKTPQHHSSYLSGIKSNLAVVANTRQDLMTLAANAENSRIAKNDIEQAVPIGQNRSIRQAALIPGPYRRQMERIRAAQEAARSAEQYNAARRIAVPTEIPEDPEGLWWTAELSMADAGGASRSIYSGEDLEPVLPQLIRMGDVPEEQSMEH